MEGAPPPVTHCVSAGGSHSGARRALLCPAPEKAAARLDAAELPKNTPSCRGMGARLPSASLASAIQYLGGSKQHRCAQLHSLASFTGASLPLTCSLCQVA